MKSLLLFVSFGLVIGSCSSDSPVTEKVEAKAGDAVSPAAAMDTGFKAYSGIVPCADCSGLAIDLQLRDAFRMETYQFILRETHQGASAAKAKTIESRGFYNFWRGNDTDPDATILVLNDDSTEDKKKCFMRLSDSAVQLVDHHGNAFPQAEKYTLHRINQH